MLSDEPSWASWQALPLSDTWTLQGLWVLLTLAPSLAAMTTLQTRPLDLFAAVGLAVWALGFGIEVAADR